MDPYSILELPRNHTLDQLKSNYKKLVMKYHPDARVNSKIDVRSTPMFQALTQSYKKLVALHKSSGKEHHELKYQHKRENNSNSQPPQHKNFNIEKFNKHFDDNKMADSYIDSGYNDWLKSNSSQKNESAIIHYSDPMPFYGASDNSMELGVNRVEDYSHLKGKLQYMDLKLAYTTTKLVDESKVNMRKDFKNIDQLQKHRSNTKFHMNDVELAKYNADNINQAKKEKNRLHNLKKKDDAINKHYNATKTLCFK